MESNKPWAVVRIGDKQGRLNACHLIPVYDVQDHEVEGCWCGAIETLENRIHVVRHNSGDGRELLEPLPRGH